MVIAIVVVEMFLVSQVILQDYMTKRVEYYK